MLKVLLLFVLLISTTTMWAQEVSVERSQTVIEQSGKRFYLHVVQPGQTFFSICKCYGVEVDEVKRLNGKMDYSLSIGEALRIPYMEEEKKLDDKYYYHRMRPKETLFSLSRKFGVRLKRILKDNPMYDEYTPIPTGAVVRLPLKQLNTNILEAELAWQKKLEQRQQEEEKIELEAELKTERDTVKPWEEQFQIIEEVKDTNNYTFVDNSFNMEKKIRVALLLPFYLSKNKLPEEGEMEIDSLSVNVNDERERLYAKSEPFVQFYEGFLIALDSLKRLGYQIELKVYDTERDTVKIREIAPDLISFSPQLIIGPVYADEFEALSIHLADQNIPMIYPLSARVEGLEHFSNLIQLNSSSTTLSNKMVDWVVENGQACRLVTIDAHVVAQPSSEEQNLVARISERLPKEEQVKIVWEPEVQPDSLKCYFDPSKENLVVLPSANQTVIASVLPTLSALADQYKITVVGLPEWMKFTTLDDEMFFKLNVKLLVNTYVDYDKVEVKTFSEKYWTYFSAEPTHIAFRAFDIGLFFIPRIAAHPLEWREHLLQEQGVESSSCFQFGMMNVGQGIENKGCYLLHFSSDYQIKVMPAK